jgi:Flp pilus assembly protein TadD
MSHLDSLGQYRRAASVVLLALVAGCTTVAEENIPPVPASPAKARIITDGAETLDLAERALYEGRVGDARTLLNRTVFSVGNSPRSRLLAAEVQLAGGSYRSAAAAFRALTSEEAVRAAALQGEGIALALTGSGSESGYESLRAAVALNPRLSRAWNALGYYHDSRREWRQANESYTRALAADPNSAMILNNRGFSMLMQGRVKEALADLGRALRYDPALRPARENMRLALAWDGQYALALAGAEGKDMGRVLNNVGYVALLRGDREDAEAFLLRAIEEDPAFNAIAARNLDYLRQGRVPVEDSGIRDDWGAGGVPRPQ